MKVNVISLLVCLFGSLPVFPQGLTYDDMSSKMTKREMERMFEEKLSSYADGYEPAARWAPESPVRLSDDVWVVGKGFYEDPSCRCAVFYTRSEDGCFSPLVRADMPQESVRTLSSVDCGLPITAHMALNRYGFTKAKGACPLGALVSCLLSEGCTPYVQIEGQSEERKTTLTLLMVNRACGYNHVLKMEYPLSVLEDRCGDVDVTMNCYVPTSNVRSIYSEREKDK